MTLATSFGLAHLNRQLVNKLQEDAMRHIEVPRDRSDQVAGLLILAGDRLRRASDKRFTRWGMSESHYNVLRILNGAGRSLSQVEISRKLLYSRSNITKLVDCLEKKGLVRRAKSEDRRKYLVSVTAQGSNFLGKTIDEVIRSSGATVEPLTRRELIELESLLAKLLKNNPALQRAAKEHEWTR